MKVIAVAGNFVSVLKTVQERKCSDQRWQG